MKGPADARAELARLQRRELSDTCEAVTEQKIVIDELIKASAIPYIDRLPTELLAQTFPSSNIDGKSLPVSRAAGLESRDYILLQFGVRSIWGTTTIPEAIGVELGQKRSNPS